MLANNLNEIRSLGHLLAYLVDELDWPLEDETKLENLTFDYTPEELDLRFPIVVRRLRPLTANQPWGIVLLDFAEKTLSINAIRNVLRGFVQRKRQDEQSDRPAWALEHLLFICLHRGEEGRTLTFVHFEQPAIPGRIPRLSSFGWSEQSNNRTVLEHNLPALRWPKDPKDAAAWLKQWQSAFDVEAVTKKFFTAYREVFADLELAIQGVPEELKRNYTQRLFNRLLFLYFIQRKGWLEFQGQKNYLRAIFDAAIAKKENFLNDRLYWTFFYGLNTAMEDRETHSLAELTERRGTVPFLNGGLFDLEDEYDVHEAVTIPNASFAQILELFERFNFTVSESTPLDIEVAVDPEMLGKVFEELVTGRHESGSYYTPRTIVSFMCREAIKHFLAPAESDAVAVARFVDEGDPAMLTAPERVLAALKAVTVCDPACGSGAYLLGMMQELLRLREALFAVHQKDHRQIFDRKLEIIQNNLYGADLDLFAVNIAKLRLWLSLAVDFGGVVPPPLPNLDFKIECGDSLTAPDPKTADNIVRSALIDHADELETLKRQFVTAHGDEKKQLKSEIQTCQDTLDRLVPDRAPGDAIDWRIAFIEVFERGGFDVVVGNPPYVRQEEIKHLKPQLKKIYQCYTGVADLFIYFYERGIKLLKPGGQFAFITSNKWYRSGYGEKLRSFLAAETRLHGLIDFGDAPVFDAIAYPTIVLLERNPPPAEANFRGFTWQPGPPVEEFATIFRKQAFDIPQTSLHKGGWRLEGSAKRNLLDKLRAGGTPLGEYCEGRFYYGIKTGLNDAFVVDRETRDRLIAEHKSSDAVLKPFLRGRDVKRWRVEPKDLWLIKLESSANATHPWTGQSDKVAEKTYTKTYPAIHAFHQQFRDGLIKREDQGKYYWELRSCIYWQEFDQPKIVYPDIAPDCTFASDSTSLLLDCTLYMIPEAPLYFLPILNSSANNYFISQICPAIRGGYRRFKSIYMTQIPIPAASVADRAALEKLVQKIVKCKEADATANVSAWEAEINARVYRLFGLTPDEIATIEATA